MMIFHPFIVDNQVSQMGGLRVFLSTPQAKIHAQEQFEPRMGAAL